MENPRARDSHIAILAYFDRCPPYINLLHLFVSSLKINSCYELRMQDRGEDHRKLYALHRKR